MFFNSKRAYHFQLLQRNPGAWMLTWCTSGVIIWPQFSVMMVLEDHLTVLKASVIKCRMISSIDILDLQCIPLIDTSHLNPQSAESREIFNWLIWVGQLLSNCWSSVDWVSTTYWSGQSRVRINNWPWMPLHVVQTVCTHYVMYVRGRREKGGVWVGLNPISQLIFVQITVLFPFLYSQFQWSK